MDMRLSISKAELERCSGRCRQVYNTTDDGMLSTYMLGASDALEILTDVEHGDNEERVLTKLSMRYKGYTTDDTVRLGGGNE